MRSCGRASHCTVHSHRENIPRVDDDFGEKETEVYEERDNDDFNYGFLPIPKTKDRLYPCVEENEDKDHIGEAKYDPPYCGDKLLVKKNFVDA